MLRKYFLINNYIKEMTHGIEYLLDNIRKLEELHKNKKIECVILFPYIPIDLRTDYLKIITKKIIYLDIIQQ